MITWTGKTTDGRKVYSHEAEDYKRLYEGISEKYGYGEVFGDYCYEMAILLANGEDSNKFGDNEDFDYGSYSDWYEDDDRRLLNDSEYKEMMLSNNAQAYYQDFY